MFSPLLPHKASTQVSKGYPGVYLVNTVCFPADHIAQAPSLPTVPQQHATSGSGKVEEMSRKLITCSDYLSVSGEFPLLSLFGNFSHP